MVLLKMALLIVISNVIWFIHCILFQFGNRNLFFYPYYTTILRVFGCMDYCHYSFTILNISLTSCYYYSIFIVKDMLFIGNSQY